MAKSKPKNNVVGWFEIPVTDMDRAVQFYEEVLGFKLERHNMGELEMAWFPMDEKSLGAPGSLVRKEDFYQPSDTGVLVYFTASSGDLCNELGRVEDAGGRVVVDKTEISDDVGYMAVIVDTEGNRIALHSRA